MIETNFDPEISSVGIRVVKAIRFVVCSLLVCYNTLLFVDTRKGVDRMEQIRRNPILLIPVVIGIVASVGVLALWYGLTLHIFVGWLLSIGIAAGSIISSYALVKLIRPELYLNPFALAREQISLFYITLSIMPIVGPLLGNLMWWQWVNQSLESWAEFEAHVAKRMRQLSGHVHSEQVYRTLSQLRGRIRYQWWKPRAIEHMLLIPEVKADLDRYLNFFKQNQIEITQTIKDLATISLFLHKRHYPGILGTRTATIRDGSADPLAIATLKTEIELLAYFYTFNSVLTCITSSKRQKNGKYS